MCSRAMDRVRDWVNMPHVWMARVAVSIRTWPLKRFQEVKSTLNISPRIPSQTSSGGSGGPNDNDFINMRRRRTPCYQMYDNGYREADNSGCRDQGQDQ